MRTVRTKEPATIGAKHLNGFVRRDRTLSNGLRSNDSCSGLAIGTGRTLLLRLDELRCVVGAKVLHDPLRDESHRENRRDGQQNPQNAAGHIYPEIAECLHLAASNTSNERDRER